MAAKGDGVQAEKGLADISNAGTWVDSAENGCIEKRGRTKLLR
jgi:hypothetical protein